MSSKISAKNLVTKHNELIQAQYKLTVAEQRLILACICQIDSRVAAKLMPETISVSAEDYAALYHIDVSTAYRQIKQARDRLMSGRKITLQNDKNVEREAFWVSDVAHFKRQGRVELTFSKSVRKYLSQLSGNFTSYEIRQVSRMNKEYTFRFYEFLMQYKSTGKRRIGVDELRAWLNLVNGEYSAFKDFRVKILDKSIKEITAHTNLEVKYEKIKNGKQVTHLEFVFYDKEQLALEL
jgi:plasmid replication initiation protein